MNKCEAGEVAKRLKPRLPAPPSGARINRKESVSVFQIGPVAEEELRAMLPGAAVA